MSSANQSKRFRVAFSFAGEKRAFVEATARILANRFSEDEILYDKFHEAEFARYDQGIYLPKLYGEQSTLIVPVLCANYDQKRWTGWEWAHIYGLLTKTDGNRVMPSRFDYANADGLSPAAGFIELDNKTPQEFATLILQRLALNEGLFRDHYMISNIESIQTSRTNSSQDTDVSSGVVGNSDDLHRQLALKLLKKSQAYSSELKTLMKSADENEIIERFSCCLPQKVGELFDFSRKALRNVSFIDLNDAEKQGVLDAVTALYMLAAIRLVEKTSKQTGHVIQIPRNEEIVCAIISIALFGGSLIINPERGPPLPQPQYTFEIYAPAAGDHSIASFERAIFTTIYQNHRAVDLSTLDSAELNGEETSRLIKRLHTIRAIEEQNVCLVVKAGISANSATSTSDKFKVPTLFKSEEVATVLLGMSYEDLIAEIEEFWRQIDKIRHHHLHDKQTTGEQPVPNVQNNFYAPIENLAQPQGVNSIGQAGANQSVTINQQTGLQISELMDLINHQIVKAIEAYPSEIERNLMKAHLAKAQQELEKPKRDKNLIEKSLEFIKGTGEAIESGEKIAELCAKALPFVACLPNIF